MSKKTIALLLAVFMVMSAMCLAGCGNKNAAGSAETAVSGSGTEDDPWLVGAGENKESVQAFVIDGVLWINGSGAMMDFENEADRPWNTIIAEVNQISIFDEVSRIGKNAFKDAGTKADSLELGIYAPVEVIGESAFEGCCFTDCSIITIPESVKEIQSRAFAANGLKTVYIDGVPTVSEDAFAGVNAEFFIRNNCAWDESNMLSYGGEISYHLLYAFDYIEDYGTEDISGEGTVYVPEGEVFEYNAEDYLSEEGYHFEKYEVMSGNLVIENAKNPALSVMLTEDVAVRIVYAAD